MAHVALTAVGTRGDVQPLLAIASALASRGARVSFLTHAAHFSWCVAALPSASFVDVGPTVASMRARGDAPLAKARGVRATSAALAAVVSQLHRRWWGAALGALGADRPDIVVRNYSNFYTPFLHSTFTLFTLSEL